MEHNLDTTISLLERTPPALDALLRGLPSEWILLNEGEGTWNVPEVIGHLIYAEHADWMPRVRTILQYGESKTFDPFDRWGFIDAGQGKTLEQLLDEFACVRKENLNALHTLSLKHKDFELRGRHPALGSVSMAELLATWAVHDLTHLHQISRIMAHQYGNAVGPWQGHLGVLQCAGHSS